MVHSPARLSNPQGLNYIQPKAAGKLKPRRSEQPQAFSVDKDSFTAVAPADTLPEKGLSCFQVDGVAIVICRFRNEYFALKNECSHALSSFDEGRVKGFRLICPLHGGIFDIRDGAAVGLPARRGIQVYPVRIRDGMLEVDVSSAD